MSDSRRLALWTVLVLSGSAASTPNDDVGKANSATVEGGGPDVSIGDVSITEGNVGTVTAFFTVTLSSAFGVPITVNFATADGTATTANNDYLPRSGVLTFAPLQITGGITVSVVGDT